MIKITGIASLQLMEISNAHEPIIINIDEAIETTASETNIFIESMSEVRFVNKRDGLVF
jgi:hypothetical protein